MFSDPLALQEMPLSMGVSGVRAVRSVVGGGGGGACCLVGVWVVAVVVSEMFLQPGTTAQHQQLATINGSRVNIYLALSASYHQAHIITNANKMFAQIC